LSNRFPRYGVLFPSRRCSSSS